MVYLLHFHPPYRKGKGKGAAGHYIGWTENRRTLAQRVDHDRAGRGARLTQVASAAGCELHVVRIWSDGDRNDERRLKNTHHRARYCPVCAGRIQLGDEPEVTNLRPKEG